jgi:hypothetical protein
MQCNGKEQVSITAFSRFPEAIADLPAFNVTQMATILHFRKNAILAIWRTIIIPPTPNIQPLVFPRHVICVILLTRDGSLHLIRIMTVNLFRYIQASIKESGIHVLSVIQMLQIILFSHASAAMNTIKHPPTGSTVMSEVIHMTAMPVTGVIQEGVGEISL